MKAEDQERELKMKDFNVSQSQPLGRGESAATPSAQLSGPEESYEVINRYGNVIATAGSEELARQDVRYRIAHLGQAGVWVRKRIVTYEVVYKPRLVRVLPTSRDIESDLATRQLEKIP